MPVLVGFMRQYAHIMTGILPLALVGLGEDCSRVGVSQPQPRGSRGAGLAAR